MADDNNRRPLHPSASFSRPADGVVSAPTGSDPLAELARLIGQTDPFAEFGREGRSPAASPPVAAEPPLDWNARPVRHDTAPAYGHDYAVPQHADVMQNAQPPGRGDFVPGMVPPVADGYHNTQPAAPGYESAGYFPEHLRGHPGDEHYDDVPPPRRRISIVAIAGVFALVILGTAGAFGYRALFGSSGSAPPPVIKADANPSKIVPPTSNASSPNKLISDRIGERVQGEKLVSREEQPVDVKERAAQMPSSSAPASGPAAAAATLTEPKKIKTIAIRPDQATTASAVDSMPARPAVATNSAPPQPAPAARVANTPLPLNASEPPPARQIPPPAAAAHSNGPLSLSAGASEPGPTRVASAPARSAPPTPNGGQGLYAVQVSSQRSEADAQASFQALKGRYPAQLGNRQAFIRRADLGTKGVYYRALVGPFASAGEASDLCSALKAAGGSCIIQRN